MLRIDDELIVRKNGVEITRYRVSRKTGECRRYGVFVKTYGELNWTEMFVGNLVEARRHVEFAVSVYKNVLSCETMAL